MPKDNNDKSWPYQEFHDANKSISMKNPIWTHISMNTIILEKFRQHITNAEEEQLVALEASYMKLRILIQHRITTS